MTRRIFLFVFSLLVFNHVVAQGGWGGQNYYQVWTDSVTDVTDWEATIHGHFSMIRDINYGNISWTPIISPSVSYNTTQYQLPGPTTPSDLPYNSPSVEGTGIQLNQPTSATVQNIPFSIKLTGLASGTRYYYVTRIHSSYGSRTYLSANKNFVTTHNGSHFSAKDSLQWLVDTATQYFAVATEIPLATSNTTANVKAYYLENFSWTHSPKHVGNMFYGPMVIYKSTNPNILSEVMAGNYFDHHVKEGDYWSFPPGKGPANASTLSLIGLNPNQKYYFTSSLFFEFIHRTSVYGGYASGISFRRFGTVDSMNCQTDSIRAWLKDTATSYFNVKVFPPDNRSDSNVMLGAMFTDDKLFPGAANRMPLKYGPLILYIGQSKNLVQECKNSNYFNTHTLGTDYWILDSMPSASDSLFKYLIGLDTSRHYYYTASMQFEFNRAVNGPYARELSTIRFRLFSYLDSLMKHNPISNNIITSGDQVLCEITGRGAVQPSQITASIPSGASGSYQYVWQHSYDNKKTWETAGTATGGDNSPYTQNFTPSSYWTDQPSVTYFRRIVTSAEYTDISLPVAVKVFPPRTTEIAVIEQCSAPKGQVCLNASFSPKYGNGAYQWMEWYRYLHGGQMVGRWKAMDGETSNQLLITSPTDSDYYYVQIGYDPQCNLINSKVIGITPPDGDGNYYPTTKVGAQYWMISNLKTTKYLDGAPITYSPGNNHWAREITLGSSLYTWYQNDSLSYSLKYGALYSWKTVGDTAGLCPAGWHVPSESDWMTLSYYVGGTSNTNPANYLKSNGDTWKDDNSTRPNSLNFNGLPAGRINYMGNYSGLYFDANWWAAKDFNLRWSIPTLPSSTLLMESNSADLFNTGYSNGTPSTEVKGLGNSIRCIRNYVELE